MVIIDKVKRITGNIGQCLSILGNIVQYLAILDNIFEYISISNYGYQSYKSCCNSIKIVLFWNFLNYFLITCTSYRGAFAPKKSALSPDVVFLFTWTSLPLLCQLGNQNITLYQHEYIRWIIPSTIYITVLRNYKDNYDTVTNTVNKSMGFDPDVINLVYSFPPWEFIVFCCGQQNWKASLCAFLLKKLKCFYNSVCWHNFYN